MTESRDCQSVGGRNPVKKARYFQSIRTGKDRSIMKAGWIQRVIATAEAAPAMLLSYMSLRMPVVAKKPTISADNLYNDQPPRTRVRFGGKWPAATSTLRRH